VPLLANMTEFGRSRLLDARTLAELGSTWSSTRSPVCAWLGGGRGRLRRLRDDGTQAGLVDRMQTRARLYELLGYRDYAAFDRRVHDFEL
jgi:methylisocitrate lyase